jgi:hypothetical protein
MMVTFGVIFFKMYKIVHVGKMYNSVHLENVNTIFSFSSVGSVHISKMYNFDEGQQMTTDQQSTIDGSGNGGWGYSCEGKGCPGVE